MIFKEAFMNYPIILLLIDPEDGKILAANNKAAEVYEYPLEKLNTMNIMDLNKFNPKKIKEEMENARSKNKNYFHFPHVTSSGKIILMDVQSLPTIINNKQFLVSFIYPCKSKEYLNNSVMRFIREAKTLAKVRNNFFSNMSHNMRTPMNAVINYAKFGMDESKNEKEATYFKQIYTSGNYLLKILNENLEKENTKTHVLKKEIISLKEIFLNILTITTPKAKSKKINLITNLEKFQKKDEKIFCNKTRISQLIINSLNNAIKYSEINQNLILDINLLKLDSNKYSLEYTIICTDSNEEKITSISKIPVELIKEIENLKIPDKYKNEGSKNYDTSLKILVCEDNEINFKIIHKLLSSKGHNVDIAENGLIGLNKVKSKKYDLIIMDIKMPIMDGLEASKEIRKFDKHIPIIALSANSYEKDIQKSLEVGMNIHLSKPIEPKKLFETLKILALKKTTPSISL